jgi:hypothetical protein
MRPSDKHLDRIERQLEALELRHHGGQKVVVVYPGTPRPADDGTALALEVVYVEAPRP